jgi:hypothetical protein
MAMEPESWNGLPIPRGHAGGRDRLKPKKRHEDMVLCVALVVLLVWALVVGLGGVNW